jgi:ATP-dependent DNA helicase RecG
MAEINPENFKESETVELKEQFSDSALKTLAAFANTKGGSLYVGVKDNKTLLSGGITDKAQQDVVSKTMNILGITPEVSLHNHKHSDFLEVQVKQQRPPVSVRGKYYQRVGNTTREVMGDALRQLFLEGASWDDITDEQFSLDDIDDEEIRRFEQLAHDAGRIPTDVDTGNIKAFLQRLGLIVDDQLTNAAIMVFGKNPQQYFPNAVVRIGRFRNEATIVADRTVKGNLFNQVREAEEQIKSLINVRYEIPEDSFHRRDVWQYPLAAFREALLNELVHRNYFEMNVKIQIKIFDDYLWMYNPGKLPKPLKIEDLKKPHSSHPRNQLIASTFHRAGLIEEWGSGIQRMINALDDENLPEPEFEEQGSGFVTKIFGHDMAGDKPDSDILKSLNDRQHTAIDLAKNGEIQASDMQEEFPDVSRKTITRDLKELVNKGLLKQEGTKKSTRYILDL